MPDRRPTPWVATGAVVRAVADLAYWVLVFLVLIAAVGAGDGKYQPVAPTMIGRYGEPAIIVIGALLLHASLTLGWERWRSDGGDGSDTR